jgi:hypothetical protein
MTLSEIETILEELALRHDNLNTELLTTLLLSAGWEDKNIKDAVTLFKQKEGTMPVKKITAPPAPSSQPATPLPQQKSDKEEITFYQPDGTEEKELHFVENTTTIKREEKKEEKGLLTTLETSLPTITIVKNEEVDSSKELDTIEDKKEEAPVKELDNNQRKYVEIEELTGDREEAVEEIKETPRPPEIIITEPSVEKTVIEENTFTPVKPTPIFKEPEQQSLVEAESPVQEVRKTKETEIPADLPLLPFESSPHVWSFSRYKNVFHKEDVPETTTLPAQKVIPPIVSPPQTEKSHLGTDEIEEISLEKTPFTREDESLVFLAGAMLLVIILILGYMYSNGRL